MQFLKHIIDDFSHLFFPHVCAGCASDLISDGTVLCLQCISQLPVTNFHLYADNPVEKIFSGRLRLSNAASYCYFTKNSLIQRILFQIKYQGNQELGYFAGRLMGESLGNNGRFNDIDAIIPLPLFATRQRKRGYNQAALLSLGISQVTGIPVIDKVLTRVSNTSTQTHKNRVERWQNMEGRFTLADRGALENKHVLLVDDVVTTGATLEAAGTTILEAENTRLSIITLAFTVK